MSTSRRTMRRTTIRLRLRHPMKATTKTAGATEVATEEATAETTGGTTLGTMIEPETGSFITSEALLSQLLGKSLRECIKQLYSDDSTFNSRCKKWILYFLLSIFAGFCLPENILEQYPYNQD